MFLRNEAFSDFRKLYLFFATLLVDIEETKISEFLDELIDKKKDKKDKKDCKDNKAKKVKAYSYGKKIHINNPNKQKGHIKIVNSKNGKVVKEVTVPAETTTTVDTNSGTYVIITTVEADVNSENVIAY